MIELEALLHLLLKMSEIPWRIELEKELSITAYLDLSNMFHWQKVLNWNFRIEDVIFNLFNIRSIKQIKIYYGFDEKNYNKSKGFHKRIRKTGAILISKPVKYIRKNIDEAFFFKRKTLNLFDDEINLILKELIEKFKKTNLILEEPKCNFDVEITMDVLDDYEKITGIILFSGDSDFYALLKRLRKKDKNIYIVGVRWQTSRELFKVCKRFINFGKFYQGKKNYL